MKKFFALLLLLSFCLGLTACAGSDSTPASSAPAPAEETSTTIETTSNEPIDESTKDKLSFSVRLGDYVEYSDGDVSITGLIIGLPGQIIDADFETDYLYINGVAVSFQRFFTKVETFYEFKSFGWPMTVPSESLFVVTPDSFVGCIPFTRITGLADGENVLSEPRKLSDCVLNSVSFFENGYTWGEYYSNAGQKVTAAFDVTGNIIFKSNADSEISYKSPFSGGYAYISEKASDGSSYDILIDTSGNEIYRQLRAEDDFMLGYANGLIFRAGYKAGIATFTENFSIFDLEGEEISNFSKDYDSINALNTGRLRFYKDVPTEIIYIGEGWYTLESKYGGSYREFFINPDKNIMLTGGGGNYTPSIHNIVGKFNSLEEGLLAITGEKWQFKNVGISDGGTGYVLCFMNRDMQVVKYYKPYADLDYWHISDNLTYYRRTDNCFCDLMGNKVEEVSIYPTRTKACSPIWSGFSVVQIDAADGNEYYTVIDQSGSEQFELVQDRIYIDRDMIAETRYLLLVEHDSNDIYIIDPTGKKIHNITADFRPITTDIDIEGGGSNVLIAYAEGYLRISYTVNGERKYKLYSVAEAVASGDERFDVGVLRKSDPIVFPEELSKENSVSDLADPATAPEQKNYTFIRNFSIEGKWKSVGEYGFGQAQPGAIVAFDGKNCNLYSPIDTYAFYTDGDHYILDATSVLPGTVSFKVYTIDTDHIDLVNGGQTTELERVG